MRKRKKKSYKVYYNEEALFETQIMAEIPYNIVGHYMNRNDNTLEFNDFKSKFESIKKIISKKGDTQFILEEEGLEQKRKSDYVTQNRELITYKNNKNIKFGVYSEWEHANEKSNFSKFIGCIEELGYIIEYKEINEEGGKEVSKLDYDILKRIVENIICKQNIKIEDLGVSEDLFNNNFKCFDMALIKKIAPSNTDSKGVVNGEESATDTDSKDSAKGNQSTILLSGDQRGIFPYIKAAEYGGFQVAKAIIFKLNLRLMSNNIAYLKDKLDESQENTVINSYITTNETKDGKRLELGCKSLDGNEYVEFYENLPVNGRLIVIKLRGKLEYIFLAVKDEDLYEYFELSEMEDIMTFFEKPVTNLKNKDERTFVSSNNVMLEEPGINKIYFGAPGTGKSKLIKEKYYREGYTKRVTFHPEYTYNDFVGYIRPIIIDGGGLTYKFVPGIFTQILQEALMDGDNMYTLIIEELNRANTAAVFGDLFQLLDRDTYGLSEFRIHNTDIYEHIKDTIKENYKYNDGSIGIPHNLNIIATMNTADQNVFVMDTAFKRRWEFEYIDIKFDDDHQFKDNKILNLNISWREFVTVINEFMMSKENEDLMISEDKQIGPYFVKSDELMNSKKFGYKVLLYLWDDVFKMDRYKIFNEEIRTFSSLIEKFSSKDALDIFKSNISEQLKTKNTDKG